MITSLLKMVAAKRFVILSLATGFGAGYCPKIPGTAGTLVGVLLFVVLAPLPGLLYALVVILLGIFGVWLCGQAAQILQHEDPPKVVWDEMVGYLLAVALVPRAWAWALAGFVLFRLFDIFKPGPVGWAEQRFNRGLGIMMDDWVAGGLTLLLLLPLSGLWQWLAG